MVKAPLLYGDDSKFDSWVSYMNNTEPIPDESSEPDYEDIIVELPPRPSTTVMVTFIQGEYRKPRIIEED